MEKLLFTVNLDYVNLSEVHLFNNDDLKVKRLGTLEIWVNGNEGPKAHFHLKNSSFETCILIYRANYLHHKSIARNGILNSAQCKALNDYLKEEYQRTDDGKAITRWDVVKTTWATFNPDQQTLYPLEYTKQSQITSQPDYTRLKNTEEE